MAKYNVFSLKFMTIRGEGNYYFLGMCNEEVKRVYIPTLNKSFSYNEVAFGCDLTSEYVAETPASGAVTKEWDGEEFYYSSKHPLNTRQINAIEKHYNSTDRSPKVDPKFRR